MLLKNFSVAVQNQANHEANDITWRKVLAGIFVGLFIEFSDEFFKDRPHRMVVHTVGVKVNRAELAYQLEKQALLVQQVDIIAEAEILDNIPHVFGEPVDVGDEVLPMFLASSRSLLKSNLEML